MSTNDFNPETSTNDTEGVSGVMYSELPERAIADVRRAFGRDEKHEVPAWVGLAVIAEFQAHHRRATGRSRAIRFGTIAAALALAVFAGMRFGVGNGKTVPPTAGDATGDSTGVGPIAMGENKPGGVKMERDRVPSVAPGAPLADLATKLTLKSAGGGGGGGPGRESTSNMPSETLRLAMRPVVLDLDHNGRTDILDALILAKTMLNPSFYGYEVEKGADEAPTGILLAKADSTWDLTHDGTVDDKDFDALVAEIVKIGGA
ncbi:MAG: hypothetical protein AABZ53_12700 [Planctomycetota bacterium]